MKEDDDVDLEISFVVDESLKDNLKVSLIFPYEETDQLQYRKAILQTPSGHFLNFMRLDFLYAWGIDWPKPEVSFWTHIIIAITFFFNRFYSQSFCDLSVTFLTRLLINFQVGEYILKTRRKEDMSTPILITVAGTPSSSESPITLKVWTETVFNLEVNLVWDCRCMIL